MSRQVNTTAIGVFVLGAIALAIAGLMVFGSGKLLTEKIEFVLFFEGSVKGLNVGAPVAFKGVKVGSVTDIKILLDSRDFSLRIPVFIAIEPDRLSGVPGTMEDSKPTVTPGGGQIVNALVTKGLRAQLAMQSLVTGLLFVDLDFYPDKSPRLTNVPTGYQELPTIPSRFEQLSRTIDALPVDELAEQLLSAIEGIEQFVNSPKLAESVTSFNQALKDAQVLLRNLDTRTEALSSSLDTTLGEAKLTLKSTRTLMTDLNRRLGPLAGSLEKTLDSAQQALKQTERALLQVEDLAGENSAVRYELTEAFRELATAARSVRQLGDTLHRNPEAVIRGKKGD